MKHLLTIFVFMVLLYANVSAQESNGRFQEEMSRSESSGSQISGRPNSNSSLPGAKHASYGPERYGGRAEVFVSGLFGSRADGNGITGEESDAGGAALGYRFHLNASSALEGRYRFSRNSQKYTIGGTVSSLSTYFSSGGVALFIPENYGAPAIANSGTGTPVSRGGIPAGYTLPPPRAKEFLGPVYAASSAGVRTQAKGMFLYGVGADIPASAYFYFRSEFRGLGYETPDFKLNALHTNAFSFSYEPTMGMAYRLKGLAATCRLRTEGGPNSSPEPGRHPKSD